MQPRLMRGNLFKFKRYSRTSLHCSSFQSNRENTNKVNSMKWPKRSRLGNLSKHDGDGKWYGKQNSTACESLLPWPLSRSPKNFLPVDLPIYKLIEFPKENATSYNHVLYKTWKSSFDVVVLHRTTKKPTRLYITPAVSLFGGVLRDGNVVIFLNSLLSRLRRKHGKIQ